MEPEPLYRLYNEVEVRSICLFMLPRATGPEV